MDTPEISRDVTGPRPTWAEIDLEAVRHNCSVLRRLVGERTQLCAVVKANAYGHGDVQVAKACLDAGAAYLGVALVSEGVRLREAGFDAPVLVLMEAPPDAAAAVVAHRLTPSLATREGAEAVSEAAAVAGRRQGIHVSIDTGMHREGAPVAEALDLILYAAGLPAIEIEGVWSHLAVADERDHPATQRQLELFDELVRGLGRAGLDVPLVHIANSAGAMASRDTHYDLVRAGIALYGLYPAPWLRESCELRPAMRLLSRVGSVRRVPAGEGVSYGLTYAPSSDSNIAAIPIGYADGYMRLLSSRGEVLIGGRRFPVAGRVTMDQILVDCGRDDVVPGEEVVLIGRQGGDEIAADELADLIGTINYEIVSSVGPRVPRVYSG